MGTTHGRALDAADMVRLFTMLLHGGVYGGERFPAMTGCMDDAPGRGTTETPRTACTLAEPSRQPTGIGGDLARRARAIRRATRAHRRVLAAYPHPPLSHGRMRLRARPSRQMTTGGSARKASRPFIVVQGPGPRLPSRLLERWWTRRPMGWIRPRWSRSIHVHGRRDRVREAYEPATRPDLQVAIHSRRIRERASLARDRA